MSARFRSGVTAAEILLRYVRLPIMAVAGWQPCLLAGGRRSWKLPQRAGAPGRSPRAALKRPGPSSNLCRSSAVQACPDIYAAHAMHTWCCATPRWTIYLVYVCSSSRCEIHGHIEDGDEKLPFCLSPICGNGADFRPWLLRVELHIMGLIGFNFRERPDLISILVIDDCWVILPAYINWVNLL